MSNDGKPMDVQLIWYQRVVTYNKLLGINPIGLSAPWDNSLEIIALLSVNTKAI